MFFAEPIPAPLLSEPGELGFGCCYQKVPADLGLPVGALWEWKLARSSGGQPCLPPIPAPSASAELAFLRPRVVAASPAHRPCQAGAGIRHGTERAPPSLLCQGAAVLCPSCRERRVQCCREITHVSTRLVKSLTSPFLMPFNREQMKKQLEGVLPSWPLLVPLGVCSVLSETWLSRWLLSMRLQ